jgi:hypothetical protein
MAIHDLQAVLHEVREAVGPLIGSGSVADYMLRGRW